MGHGAPEFIDTVAMSLVNSFYELYIQSGKINMFVFFLSGKSNWVKSELTKFYLRIGS